MAPVREEQMVFCISHSDDGTPCILLGIPEKAWEHMKDGKTHTFDFRRAGVPVQVMIYGAKDHKEAMKFIHQAAAKGGATLVDERRKDFGMKG